MTSHTRNLLKSNGIAPKTRLGQNFLDDEEALERIVSAAEINSSSTVLEIGCGLGSLTKHLAAVASRVVAVEVDAKLVEIASAELRHFANVEVVKGDAVTLELAALGLPRNYLVVANIPYYATSPILRHLLESEPEPARIVLTVQEEVANRIVQVPPRMSLLALSVQVYGSPKIVGRIPAQAFFPVPKIDSAVIRIDRYAIPLVPAAEGDRFFAIARAGFGQKRKMLRNSLASGLRISQADAMTLLQDAGIEPTRRAETLGIGEWLRLCRAGRTKST